MQLKRAELVRAAVRVRVRARAGGARSIIAVLAAGLLVTACAVPKHMHSTLGVAPQHTDTNVRFRTTYYFRVFDYCWSADANIGASAGKTYRKIVPETDTLYRYRMTGKASALGNRIKFESGTLKKAQIDPFGADVVYNNDVGGFIYRSPETTEAEAKAAAAARVAARLRDQAFDDFERLTDRLKAKDVSPEEKAEITKVLPTALEKILGTLRAPPDAATTETLNGLQARLAKLEKTVEELPARLGQPAAGLKEVEDRLRGQIAALEKDVAELKAKQVVTAFDKACSIDEIQRRGFQIMGPEGMRTFDQDMRLIMAMHSSAKPLIETLTEYSGRLLKPQVNAADQLLPLARETITIVETQRALDRAALDFAGAGDTRPGLAKVFDDAAAAFAREDK